jgi:hypothetical protein
MIIMSPSPCLRGCSYSDKRALYLGVLAKHLSTAPGVARVEFESWCLNTDKPVLVVVPGRLLVCFAAPHVVGMGLVCSRGQGSKQPWRGLGALLNRASFCPCFILLATVPFCVIACWPAPEPKVSVLRVRIIPVVDMGALRLNVLAPSHNNVRR